jgi:hypothetical protein
MSTGNGIDSALDDLGFACVVSVYDIIISFYVLLCGGGFVDDFQRTRHR